jgi:cysteine synthase
MTTMTIQVPGKAKTKLSAIVKEMGGEVISVSTDKQAKKKARLLNEIKQGLIEVKRIEAGKARSYSISDIFD